MDVAALVAFLAPCLPYLLRSGEHVAGEAADALGGEVWEQARRLWARLRGAVGGREAAQEAAEDVAAAPDDARMRGALEVQLEKLLARDADLARDVEAGWQQARRVIVQRAGDNSVIAGGDIRSSTIVIGNDNITRGER